MKDLDTSTWVLQKQVEIRRPTPRGCWPCCYAFDIVWVKPDLRKGTILWDGANDWVIHEVFGTRRMPGRVHMTTRSTPEDPKP